MTARTQTIKVITHDGFFHADEVFALAALKLCLDKEGKKMRLLRTRDLKQISRTDMAVDVGGRYDLVTGQFDHHQKGGAGRRENGTPYASFGLIWKHFGERVTSKEAAAIVERKLVQPIDAIDNGLNLATPLVVGVSDYSTVQAISAIGKSFDEKEVDLAFKKALGFAELVLKGEIRSAEFKIEGDRKTDEAIKSQGVPEVLVLDKYVPWEDAVSRFKNIKLVIFPDKTERWCIQAARDNPDIFGKDRIRFPEEWRGLSDEALVAKSGVFGAGFCHAGGFFAIVKSKEGAIEMARKAVALAEV